ncbi:MAG: 4Fe-4S binding protein [Tissierellia bacterium]|mgnify:CR=1 FL=1|nr:4Fe-4S binding protein [Tissierellia bacterium]
MYSVVIDKESCIGCGLCVSDCPRRALKLENKKAQVDPKLCNECGHCVAICPVASVSMPQYDESDILDFDKDKLNLDPDDFLYFLKFRRSIRQFKNKGIGQDELNKIIEAGRYSPTASNRQLNRYIVIKDKIDEVRELSLKALYDMAVDPNFQMKGGVDYRPMWKKMYESYKEDNEDRLFFKAPAVIVIVSENKSGFQEIDAGLAASRMELQANSLGLGVCYIGFFQRAVQYNNEIKKLIGMKEDEEFLVSFILGYPNVKYQRSVNRKKADVRFI